VLAAVSGKSEYYGNPDQAYGNAGQPYIFLNFFDTEGSFSKIVFTEFPAVGGYESDNQTVGHYLTMGSGTVIPLVNSVVSTPEPASWAMMLIGFAGLGFASHRTRRSRRVAVG
jgi:hypothetical protein